MQEHVELQMLTFWKSDQKASMRAFWSVNGSEDECTETYELNHISNEEIDTSDIEGESDQPATMFVTRKLNDVKLLLIHLKNG